VKLEKSKKRQSNYDKLYMRKYDHSAEEMIVGLIAIWLDVIATTLPGLLLLH